MFRSNPQARSLHILSQSFLLSALLFSFFLTSACTASQQLNRKINTPVHHTTIPTTTNAPNYDFPAIDANYTYDQLYYMSTTFQQRESGFDLSTEKNGHKAFANYWALTMQQNLQGFGAQVSYDNFQGGWISRPGDSSSYNVEVTISGALHPEQVVVVGSHYDGMHISQGSAFDDTSGCAIMLGQAKALADYWRSHHLYPARTLRFVIFDAEEEGIIGSYHYVNNTVNGDTTNIVAMINEEQSGFSYPVHFLGKASNPVIPLHIWNVGLQPDQPFFADLIQSALPTVASEMRNMGYSSVTYHDNNGKDVSLPVFTNDQVSNLVISKDPLGGSDDAAFDQANVPALTFIAGDEGILDPQTQQYKNPTIPDNQSYPYDTHYDTIQLMNGYANGETRKSQALVLALDFQTMLSAWMFNQSAMVGNVSADRLSTGPIATISDIGILQPGTPLKLNAQASFDPRNPQSKLNAHWDFGDGTQSDGLSIQHTYIKPGTYTLTLTVQDTNGTQHISKKLSIATNPLNYPNLFTIYIQKERTSGSELAKGDHHPRPGFQFPHIVQNGDGLTGSDHFPGHNM